MRDLCTDKAQYGGIRHFDEETQRIWVCDSSVPEGYYWETPNEQFKASDTSIVATEAAAAASRAERAKLAAYQMQQ